MKTDQDCTKAGSQKLSRIWLNEPRVCAVSSFYVLLMLAGKRGLGSRCRCGKKHGCLLASGLFVTLSVASKCAQLGHIYACVTEVQKAGLSQRSDAKPAVQIVWRCSKCCAIDAKGKLRFRMLENWLWMSPSSKISNADM